MSERVIICGVRSPNGVDIAKIKQMGGRAGRSKKDVNPVVYIVAERECLNELDSLNSVPPVSSVFSQESSVAFHLLSKIGNGSVKTKDDAKRWFGRSLSYAQGKRVDFDSVFRNLVDLNAVEERDGLFTLSKLGGICKRYYFSPETVFSWREKFNIVLGNRDFSNDYALAWALSTGRVSFDVGQGVADELLSQFPREYMPSGKCAPEAVAWISIFHGVTVPGASIVKKELRGDWGRMYRAISELSSKCGLKSDVADDYLKNLDTMVRKGVGFNSCKYFSVPGMTSAMARHFEDCGIPVEDAVVEM